MKKIIITTVALLMTGGIFAQEKEVKAALDAIEQNNIQGAKSELAKVQGQMDSNTIDPETMAKYCYTLGEIAAVEGDVLEAAKMFEKMATYERGTVYSGKNNATGNTEYFYSKEDADKAEASGNFKKLKEKSLKPNLIDKAQNRLQSLAENSLQQANAYYQGNQSNEAGDKFLEAGSLINAMGGNGDLFRYNAALSYHKGKTFQKALDIYKELMNKGYTGETTSWIGIEKDTGNEVSFPSKAEAETQQKLGLVTNVRQVKSESVEKDLANYALNALVNMKSYDPIVETIATKYPNDSEIQSMIGTIYHNSGKDDLFLKKLLETEKIDPKNETNLYNIGVLYMEQNNDAKALEYFEKAIAADANYKNAYTNIALIKVKPEKEYVEIINDNRGSSAKERKIYTEYMEKRKNLYIQAVPYLEKAFNIEKTYESAKTLRQAYQAAEMFEKEDEMRAIEKSLMNQ